MKAASFYERVTDKQDCISEIRLRKAMVYAGRIHDTEKL